MEVPPLADLANLVHPSTWRRLQQARSGADSTKRLALATAAPGEVGVVEVTVAQLQPVRSYHRKRGGTGEMCRVTLADATGEADLVLWDGEVRHVRTGILQPGAAIRLRGPTVKAGHRGGVELGLGSAVLEPVTLATSTGGEVTGTLLGLGETRILAGPPESFQADAVVETPKGRRNVVLEGASLRAARRQTLPTPVSGLAPHPVLSDWLLCTAATRVG